MFCLEADGKPFTCQCHKLRHEWYHTGNGANQNQNQLYIPSMRTHKKSLTPVFLAPAHSFNMNEHKYFIHKYIYRRCRNVPSSVCLEMKCKDFCETSVNTDWQYFKTDTGNGQWNVRIEKKYKQTLCQIRNTDRNGFYLKTGQFMSGRQLRRVMKGVNSR